MLGQALGEIERALATDVILVQVGQFGVKRRIFLGFAIGGIQIQNQRHQGFRDETPAINAEKATVIRPLADAVGQ